MVSEQIRFEPGTLSTLDLRPHETLPRSLTFDLADSPRREVGVASMTPRVAASRTVSPPVGPLPPRLQRRCHHAGVPSCSHTLIGRQTSPLFARVSRSLSRCTGVPSAALSLPRDVPGEVRRLAALRPRTGNATTTARSLLRWPARSNLSRISTKRVISSRIFVRATRRGVRDSNRQGEFFPLRR